MGYVIIVYVLVFAAMAGLAFIPANSFSALSRKRLLSKFGGTSIYRSEFPLLREITPSSVLEDKPVIIK